MTWPPVGRCSGRPRVGDDVGRNRVQLLQFGRDHAEAVHDGGRDVERLLTQRLSGGGEAHVQVALVLQVTLADDVAECLQPLEQW